MNRPIGIFDSGVGGLSVLAACKDEMQNESFIYIFDESFAPYGKKSDKTIRNRAEFLTEYLINLDCKSIIIACNTATSIAIDCLRNRFEVPIFGVEPPVLPAVKASKGGKILVLLTEASARQARIRRLLEKCENQNIILSPQGNLASLIENNFQNLEGVRGEVYKILDGYDGVESVVLGCTHYNHVRNIIEEFYFGKVKVYDSSMAVARQVKVALSSKGMLNEEKKTGCDIKIHL